MISDESDSSQKMIEIPSSKEREIINGVWRVDNIGTSDGRKVANKIYAKTEPFRKSLQSIYVLYYELLHWNLLNMLKIVSRMQLVRKTV